MKAEQRKELETNALADRMGHLMQRMKTQPRRSAMYWVVGGIVLLVVAILTIRWFQVSREENSTRWRMLDLQSQRALQFLASKDNADTNAGKAARFELAWLYYWEGGVKRLGVDGNKALETLQDVAAEYRKLAEDCAGDPIWEPEALYGQAVIEETQAVVNLDHLEAAKRLYEDLATKHKDSARGKLAAKWVENYQSDKGKQELKDFYQQMQTALDIRDQNAFRKLLEQTKKKQVDQKAK
jgi:hypothetical protein